jgi:outer membrane protein OmpA-like peptidoglycan-associated protein
MFVAKKFRLFSVMCCVATSACTSTPPPAQSSPEVKAEYKGPKLPIEQSEKGVQIFLPSTVLFDIGKADFKLADASPYLDRVASLLSTKTQRQVIVEGHTDNQGSASSNLVLSEQRAQALMNALLQRGVPTDRLKAVGYSFNRPIASNSTEEGRKLNRRVELLIVDEKIENITKGEAANAFESAWGNLKSLIERGLVKAVETK